MKPLDFWFDPVSPYSYLAFERLPTALAGVSHVVRYRPILFVGLLAHWGQKGPAEIEPKRAWTFRQAHWAAHRDGIEFATPARHPFNPLAHLRLLLAASPAGGTPSRRVCETVLRHIWRGGHDASDAARFQALVDQVAPRTLPDDAAIKQALKDNTAEAIARGIFGVPTIEVDGHQFWGADALPMLAEFVRGDAWFAGPAWDREGAPRDGVRR